MTTFRFLLCLLLFTMLAACSAKEEQVVEYYPDGKPKAEWTLRDGKRDGMVKHYFEDGRLQLEGWFKNDLQNGLTKTYDPEGRLVAEATYKDDRLDGPSKIYYPNGKIKFEGNYSEGKLVSGKEYDETGKLKSGLIRKDGSTGSLADAVPGQEALGTLAEPAH